MNATMRHLLPFLLLALIATGCQEMYDQPKVKPLSKSDFFDDALGARQPIAGTVARGHMKLDDQLYTGKAPASAAKPAGDSGASGAASGVPAQWATSDLSWTFPMPVTREVLVRGHEQFNVFCSPCHGRLGDGKGMIVQRGFKAPPSFHEERLRTAPPGYVFNVITNGFGVMYSYASRVPVKDRWAIAAYIKALQLSQNMDASQLTAEQQAALEGKK
ncbi:MAG: alternative complex III protein ActDE [Chlorobi bacterium OLB7]|nr:MAG: alternative complex III protein ActDE [Chlorobi bacterium OLB7]